MTDNILTDADRIKSIIEANGGRMYQKEIAAHVAWSDAKISIELAAMADNQEIYRQRIGREKLVSLTPLLPESYKQKSQDGGETL